MKSLLVLALFVFLFKLSFSQEKTTIFNDQNLDGWKIVLSDESIDPSTIFKVENGILKVSGNSNAYLRTIDVFTNYELHVEWRWVEKPSNSGVLLHVNGYDFWPNAIEAQLMDQHAGDIVLIGYGVAGTIADSSYINVEKRFTILTKIHNGIEKKAGEWNTYDIICKDDNISISVNGVLQNEGKKFSLTGGSIGLQSEGSPIEFKNIYLKKIN